MVGQGCLVGKRVAVLAYVHDGLGAHAAFVTGFNEQGDQRVGTLLGKSGAGCGVQSLSGR